MIAGNAGKDALVLHEAGPVECIRIGGALRAIEPASDSDELPDAQVKARRSDVDGDEAGDCERTVITRELLGDEGEFCGGTARVGSGHLGIRLVDDGDGDDPTAEGCEHGFVGKIVGDVVGGEKPVTDGVANHAERAGRKEQRSVVDRVGGASSVDQS